MAPPTRPLSVARVSRAMFDMCCASRPQGLVMKPDASTLGGGDIRGQHKSRLNSANVKLRHADEGLSQTAPETPSKRDLAVQWLKHRGVDDDAGTRRRYPPPKRPIVGAMKHIPPCGRSG